MKFLKITVNNYNLCNEDFTISFVPTANKTKEDKEFELHEIAKNLYVHKTMGIIGKNASGKTVTVKLLNLIYDIFSSFRVKNSKSIFKYENKQIDLDVTFFHEDYLYRYTTTLYKDISRIDSETILFKNQKLFKRLYKKTYYNNLFDYDKYDEVNIETNLPDDTSIIYTILHDINLRGIYLESNDYIFHDYYSVFNLYKIFDPKYKIVKSIIKIFDEHIDNLKMINENKFKIYYSNKETKEISNNELYEILSSGTTKGFSLFTFVVYSLKNGCDLIIDEIENHFHKTLVENLVNLYKDKSVNKKNASLIFTTHYAELLDLFNRTDNIYITKYDKFIYLENMYNDYKFRPELSKSKKFYNNAFNTDINYEYLMNFKKELMK